jgi:FtsZ-binding cell division protein ZapB
MDTIDLYDINIDELKKERDEMIQNNHDLFDSIIESF